MTPLMNDTKWNELRLAMYGLGELSPLWRVKDVLGNLSPWDSEWYYHFRAGGYASIEWVEIQILTPAQGDAVQDLLQKIHLPGHRTDNGFRICGYVQSGTEIGFI